MAQFTLKVKEVWSQLMSIVSKGIDILVFFNKYVPVLSVVPVLLGGVAITRSGIRVTDWANIPYDLLVAAGMVYILIVIAIGWVFSLKAVRQVLRWTLISLNGLVFYGMCKIWVLAGTAKVSILVETRFFAVIKYKWSRGQLKTVLEDLQVKYQISPPEYTMGGWLKTNGMTPEQLEVLMKNFKENYILEQERIAQVAEEAAKSKSIFGWLVDDGYIRIFADPHYTDIAVGMGMVVVIAIVCFSFGLYFRGSFSSPAQLVGNVGGAALGPTDVTRLERLEGQMVTVNGIAEAARATGADNTANILRVRDMLRAADQLNTNAIQRIRAIAYECNTTAHQSAALAIQLNTNVTAVENDLGVTQVQVDNVVEGLATLTQRLQELGIGL